MGQLERGSWPAAPPKATVAKNVYKTDLTLNLMVNIKKLKLKNCHRNLFLSIRMALKIFGHKRMQILFEISRPKIPYPKTKFGFIGGNIYIYIVLPLNFDNERVVR